MRKVIIGLVAAVVVIGGGFLAWVWFAGGSGEPTTDVTAPPLAGDSTTVPGETTSSTATSETAQGSTTSVPESTTTSGDTGSGVTFVIDGEQSTARFEIDEMLQGEDNQVVGTTNEVAGQLRFGPADLSTAEVSEILINARTFQTDSSSRDRAIRGPIVLNSASDEFELITFAPTAIEGLPESVEPGESISFTITGDLMIKGTTNEETFDVEATWDGEGQVTGTATTNVDRTDYGVEIPDVPTVADVSEEVLLALEFVATAG